MTPPPTSPAALPAASAFAEALAQLVGTLLMYIFQRLHALTPTLVRQTAARLLA